MPCVLTCLRGKWICWHQESFAALLPTSSSARSVASPACHRWWHLLLADSVELPWSCLLVRALPVTVRSVAPRWRSSHRHGSRRDVQSCVCTCTCPPSHAHPLLVEAPGTWRQVLPLRPVLSSSWRCSPSRPAECRRVPSGVAEERRSLGQAAGCVRFHGISSRFSSQPHVCGGQWLGTSMCFSKTVTGGRWCYKLLWQQCLMKEMDKGLFGTRPFYLFA